MPTFIELGNTMWININLIDKLVRDIRNRYVLILKSKERYIISTEKALTLKRIFGL